MPTVIAKTSAASSPPPATLKAPLPRGLHLVEILEWFALFAFAIAPIPLAILHLHQLETKAHYDCAWMVVVVAVLLLVMRYFESSSADRQFQGGTPVSWLLTLLTSAVALGVFFLASPWLGMVTWILGLAAVMSRTRVAWRGPWGLLWLALPLPLGWDTRLVQELQLKASRWSGHVLDLIGVEHILEGNIVRLSDRDLFVDEACSGVMSLIAVMASTAIFVVLRRRPLLVGILSVLLSAFWAVVMNVARIVTCAYAWQQYRTDLLIGTPHEVLGFATFAGAVLLALSTEQLVMLLLGPLTFPEVSDWKQVADHNPLVRAWNWLGGVTPIDEEPVAPRVRRVQFPGSVSRAVIGTLCLVLVFTPLPYLTAVEMMRNVTIDPAIEAIGEDFMPLQIGALQLVNYSVEHRKEADVFGEHSRSWQYAAGDLSVRLSVDYPFMEWHDLRACYTGIGWLHSKQPLQGEGWSGAMMYHPRGQFARLQFAILDENGQAVPSQEFNLTYVGRPQNLVHRLVERIPTKRDWPLGKTTTYQAQALASWPVDKTENPEISMRSQQEAELIEQAFEVLRSRLEAALAGSEPSTHTAAPASSLQNASAAAARTGG